MASASTTTLRKRFSDREVVKRTFEAMIFMRNIDVAAIERAPLG
jgi:hypothetical protein